MSNVISGLSDSNVLRRVRGVDGWLTVTGTKSRYELVHDHGITVAGRYMNQLLGLTMEVPVGWEWRQWEDFCNSNEGRSFGQESEEADRIRREIHDCGLPQLVFAPPEGEGAYFGGLQVAPAFGAEAVEADFDPALPSPILELALEGWAEQIEVLRYEPLERPVLFDISGCPAVHGCFRYFAEYRDLEQPLPVRERTLLIQQQDRVLEIHMYDYPEVDPGLAFDFDPVIRSLRIQRVSGVG